MVSWGCNSDTFNPKESECTSADCSGDQNTSQNNEGAGTNTISGGNGSNNSHGSTSGNNGSNNGENSGNGIVGSGSSDSTNDLSSPGGYGNYFSKINEPLDQQTSVGLPFAFKFVAVGKMPIVYKWYKESNMGRQLLGSSTTSFSKASASLTDTGVYFATVEDDEGNILTSRRARLIVNPERKICSAGNYGPVYDSRTRKYDYRNLVPVSQMTNKVGAKMFKIENEIDSYAFTIKACPYYKGSGLNCSGANTLVQCQNGSYYVLSTNCSCGEIQ